jgi:hypothetical protein
MHANTYRLKNFFLNQILPGIRVCSKHNAQISMAILCCCAIDYLAKFYSGDIKNVLNKQKYISFLKNYFPTHSPTEEFYKFVRCGLVHSYDMEGKYLIINSDADWARKIHLKYDSKHKAWILNPYSLFRDLKEAFQKYLVDLEENRELRKKLDLVYGQKPIRRQYLKTPKFKYLVKENLI